MKSAIVFPGQGSQTVGMLAELAEKYPIVKSVFAEASAALGYDLWGLTQNGPADKLNQTAITQPAMLSAGVACYKIFEDVIQKEVSVMAGHSLGEYSAYVCSGAIDFTDAIKMVAIRGKLMQEAVPEGVGAMAAILGLEDEKIIRICQETQGVVEAVNFNSPGQVVIAGEMEAVDLACEAAKANKARRVILLPVSVPSHSSLMRVMADQFSQEIKEVVINPPEIPVINNVEAKAEIDPDAIRGAMIRQLYRPVRWSQIIQNMHQSGVTHVIEAGPGKVLMGLNRRIERSLENDTIQDVKSLETLLEKIK